MYEVLDSVLLRRGAARRPGLRAQGARVALALARPSLLDEHHVSSLPVGHRSPSASRPTASRTPRAAPASPGPSARRRGRRAFRRCWPGGGDRCESVAADRSVRTAARGAPRGASPAGTPRQRRRRGRGPEGDQPERACHAVARSAGEASCRPSSGSRCNRGPVALLSNTQGREGLSRPWWGTSPLKAARTAARSSRTTGRGEPKGAGPTAPVAGPSACHHRCGEPFDSPLRQAYLGCEASRLTRIIEAASLPRAGGRS